jgi:polyphosphate kinase
LLERVKFLAIFATNLDEFYMVRVAGLKRQVDAGIGSRSPCGMLPREQLAHIAQKAVRRSSATPSCSRTSSCLAWPSMTSAWSAAMS